MDKGNFLLRDTGLHELLFQVVINAEKTVIFWGAKVTEHKLGTSLLFGLFPNADDIAGAGGNTGAEFLRFWVSNFICRSF